MMLDAPGALLSGAVSASSGCSCGMKELSVTMALAKALHHSAQPPGPVMGEPSEEVENETDHVPRHHKIPPPGMRPSSLADLGRPQRSDRAVRGSPPLLVQEEGIDTRTVQFLLAQSLRLMKEEEEGR